MKRTIGKALAVLFSLALILGLFPGCQKNAPAEEEETKNENILTNIYDRVSGADSAGMLNTFVRPWWDGETGTLTYVTTEYKEETVPSEKTEDPEDGENLVRYSVCSLVTLSEDGTSAQREILDDRDGYALGCGMLDEDGLTCAVYAYNGNNRRILLSRYEIESDRWTFGEDLSALFAQKPYSLSGLRSDRDGTLYAASDREVLFLTPDGQKAEGGLRRPRHFRGRGDLRPLRLPGRADLRRDHLHERESGDG